MKIILLANEPPSDFELRDNREKFDSYMGEWYAFGGALEEAGLLVSGEALERPDAATVVSVREGVRKVEDGPFPDTKEHLGGFFIIEAPDVDTAAEWAARCPASKTGYVDIRAIPDYFQEDAQ